MKIITFERQKAREDLRDDGPGKSDESWTMSAFFEQMPLTKSLQSVLYRFPCYLVLWPAKISAPFFIQMPKIITIIIQLLLFGCCKNAGKQNFTSFQNNITTQLNSRVKNWFVLELGYNKISWVFFFPLVFSRQPNGILTQEINKTFRFLRIIKTYTYILMELDCIWANWWY